jgi:hypothetical protein
MSAINRAALVSLLNSKVLTGGNQTTAQGVRDIFNGVIESLVNIIDDKDANGGYLGIDSGGIVDITKIKAITPLGYFLQDDGTWQPNAASNPTLQQVLTAGSTLTGHNYIDPSGAYILNFGSVTPFNQFRFNVTNTINLDATNSGMYSNHLKMDINGLELFASDDNGIDNLLTMTPALSTLTSNLNLGNYNYYGNNIFLNSTSTVSAGGTTILTVNSTAYQYLTGSSTQTYQLPDATTLPISLIFYFNNNSSSALTIVNAASTVIYTIPAGGAINVECTNNSTLAGSWDGHPRAPMTVTWGSGITGLVMNSVLSTSATISAGASSSTSPVFIPQRGSLTTGFGGDSSNLYMILGGASKFSVNSSGFITVGGVTSTGVTGSGALVFGTSPTFTTQLTTPRVSLVNGAITGFVLNDGTSLAFGSSTATDVEFYYNDLLKLKILANEFRFTDSVNLYFATTNGTKIGTTTSQKLAFWNATPIVQPANTVSINDLLVNTGLRATGGTSLFTNTVTINNPSASSRIDFVKNTVSAFFLNDGSSYAFGTSTAHKTEVYYNNTLNFKFGANFELTDAVNIQIATTTGSKIGTATTQKIGFWNTTPIVQPTTSVAAATIVNGVGTNALQDDTYDGYTIAKVVKALRNAGLLA